MPFGGLLTVGLIGGVGSLVSGALGANAATNAAGEQTQAEENALDFQQQIWNQEQQNVSPYLSLGSTSIGSLMSLLSGSSPLSPQNLPSAPQFTGTLPASFTAPTAAQAEATPGFQFTEEQGEKGILEGAAAAGGAISGGTLKALDQYNQNLAQTAYGNTFSQALQTYGTGIQGYQAGLQGYQANLAAYQANLAAQNQMYQQMFAPVRLGESAATGLNQAGQAVSTNAGNLMTNIGNAQAAGTVGSTNAITSGISGASNSFLQSLLLSKLFGSPASNTASLNIGAPTVSAADLLNLGVSSPTIPGTGPG